MIQWNSLVYGDGAENEANGGCGTEMRKKSSFNCTPRPPGLRVSEEGRMYGSLEPVYNTEGTTSSEKEVSR